MNLSKKIRFRFRVLSAYVVFPVIFIIIYLLIHSFPSLGLHMKTQFVIQIQNVYTLVWVAKKTESKYLI